MSTRRKLFATCTVLATLALLWYSARGHTSHYKMVNEVMVAHGQWLDRPLRVHGWVEAGSIDERIIDQETVVAEGKLVLEGGAPVFIATGLSAKCPSKYEGAHVDRLFDTSSRM